MAKEKITHEELVAKFNEFLEKVYKKELTKASNEGKPLVIEFKKLDKFDTDLSDMLLKKPEDFMEIAYEALDQLALENPVKIRLKGTDLVNIRDLRGS
jgi:DNA replicative helicase MCM subunit Mcm2 (Cdc46/Mcm family)